MIFLVGWGFLFTILGLLLGRLSVSFIALRDDLLLDLLGGIHFHLSIRLLLHHFFPFLLSLLSFCEGSETLFLLFAGESFFFALLLGCLAS